MKLFSRFFSKLPPAAPPPQALGTQDEPLRVAAIGKLVDGEALRCLAGLSQPADVAVAAVSPAVERAAQLRLAQLLDGSRLVQAIASIDDPLRIAQLVLDGPSSRLRQSAAEAIDDPAQLRLLLRQVRSKDKSVYKILKQKCDLLNSEERKAAQVAADTGALCAALERHSLKTFDVLYSSAFERLRDRWSELTAPLDAKLEERAHRAIDRCRAVIDAHLLQASRQAAERAAQQALQLAADVDREAVRLAAQQAAAAAAAAEVTAMQEAAAIRAEEHRARAQVNAAQEELFRLIGGLIRNANNALTGGNTQRAAALRREVEHRLPTASALPTPLLRDLHQLGAKLDELKRWKDYAVAPKRIELIEAMESLAGSAEEPKVLAERIKSLQQEWRTIGRGILAEAPTEAERFHEASQAAYQPCRVYFEAQAQLRKDNLERRKALLARLVAFENAQAVDDPDWRLLRSVLREAPREWRGHFPVDREASRPVQGEFDETMRLLQAKLDGWYERNVLHKQSLVKQAQQLLALDDGREAITAVRRLQVEWKAIGMAPRDLDQALWDEFRELCDAIFHRRHQAYADHSAGLEANKSTALRLCAEVERVAELSGPPLLEEGKKIAEWRSAFAALGELPRADARGLHDRFERAVDLCAARAAQQGMRDTRRSFCDLFEAGRRVHSYAWAVATHADPAESALLREAVETFIAGIQRWPKGGLQAVEEALTRAGTAIDCQVRERALRTLCVRCEIRNQMPTPAEDEALRQEYQVQRLVQGMGRGIHADEADLHSMMLEWIRIGAVSPATHGRLQSRFMSCCESVQDGSPR